MNSMEVFALFFIISGVIVGVLWMMKDAADTIDKESNDER